MQFSTSSQLDRLVEVFGETIVCNRRTKMPKKSDTKTLLQNDALNVVEVEIMKEDVFMKRVSDDGIDFMFDGVKELRVSVRYKRLLYQVDELPPGINQFINGTDPNDKSSESEPAVTNETTLQVDSTFLFDGKMFRVELFNESQMIVQCHATNSNETLAIAVTTAAACLSEYLA